MKTTMFWMMLRFVSFLLATMVVTHGALYFSFTRFFGLVQPRARLWLMAALAVLAIGFLLGTFSVNIAHNLLTRGLYGVVMSWWGLVVYLLLASALMWTVKAAGLLFPALVTSQLISRLAIGMYGAAVLAAAYNVWGNFALRVTPVRVAIADLPAAWDGKGIVQISDLHLGALRGIGFLEDVVARVNALEPELVVITGDLFDVASRFHHRYVDGLKRLDAKRGVYFVSGNHEVYSNPDTTRRAVEGAGIRVLDDDLVDLDGLQLIGAAFARMRVEDRKAFDIDRHPAFQPGRPSILLYHTPTDVGERSTHPQKGRSNAYLAPNLAFETATRLGISLQLSGHTHAGQMIPITWLADRIFNGFHYGLHRVGQFQIYIHSGTGTWGPPMRSGPPSEIAHIELVRN